MKRRTFLTGSLSLLSAPVSARTPDFPGIGVIFVGASWCAYCKSAAPVLAAILQPVHIPVLVASHDARPIPPFMEVQDARAHPIAGRISEFPTTLIYAHPVGAITAEITGYRNARHYALSVRQAILAASGISR